MTSYSHRHLSYDALIEAAQGASLHARAHGKDLALCGGLAMQLLGSERLTGDVDFIASSLPSWVGFPIKRRLSFGGVAGKLKGVPVDIIVRSDRYRALYREAFAKRKPSGIPGLKTVAPEYLAAMKMVSGRPKDEIDLMYLLSSVRMSPNLLTIVERHLGPYALDELQSLREEAKWLKKTGKL